MILSQIHEMDYLYWLFGLPRRIFTLGGHLSSLEIDVEEQPWLIEELLPDLVDGDMIFFTEDQVNTMETGAVNSAQDRLVDIMNKVKAKAAG